MRTDLRAVACTAITLLATCSPAPVPPPETAVLAQAARTLDSTLTTAVAEAGIVGLATAVIVDGRTVWTRAYGMADRESARSLTAQTPMGLGSIAKTAIGVTMVRLVAQGALDLDADINDYLPFRVINPHQLEAKITLRHLATHTSSITDRPDFYAAMYRPNSEPRPSLDSLLRSYLTPGGSSYQSANFLAVPPGASREYSNLGAALAALIVERAAGEPYHAHVHRVLTEPLGLRSAAWQWERRGSTAPSELYVQDSAATTRIARYALASYPDGGLQMSVEDLATYFAFVLGDGRVAGARIIDVDALREMRRFQWTAAHKPADIELSDGNAGLFWRTKFGGRRIGHGGNDPGVVAEMLTDAAGRVGIVLLANTSLHGDANRQLPTIIDALTAYGYVRMQQ